MAKRSKASRPTQASREFRDGIVKQGHHQAMPTSSYYDGSKGSYGLTVT